MLNVTLIFIYLRVFSAIVTCNSSLTSEIQNCHIALAITVTRIIRFVLKIISNIVKKKINISLQIT